MPTWGRHAVIELETTYPQLFHNYLWSLFFLALCVCVCMYVQVCTCVFFVETRGQLRFLHFVFETIAWNSFIILVWLPNEPQRSTCLNHPGYMCQYTQILMWMLWIKLIFVQHVLYCLSNHLSLGTVLFGIRMCTLLFFLIIYLDFLFYLYHFWK